MNDSQAVKSVAPGGEHCHSVDMTRVYFCMISEKPDKPETNQAQRWGGRMFCQIPKAHPAAAEAPNDPCGGGQWWVCMGEFSSSRLSSAGSLLPSRDGAGPGGSWLGMGAVGAGRTEAGVAPLGGCPFLICSLQRCWRIQRQWDNGNYVPRRLWFCKERNGLFVQTTHRASGLSREIWVYQEGQTCKEERHWHCPWGEGQHCRNKQAVLENGLGPSPCACSQGLVSRESFALYAEQHLPHLWETGQPR